MILTEKMLIINELHEDSVVKLHKTEDFWVHKLHKMEVFLKKVNVTLYHTQKVDKKTF